MRKSFAVRSSMKDFRAKPRRHAVQEPVDHAPHSREGSLPAWAETFLEGSGSSMELAPGPEDAPNIPFRIHFPISF